MRGVWALAVALGLAWGQGGDYAARCARLYAQGALEAAQATCELGLVVAPQDREVLRLLVRIHLDKGEVAQAQAYLDRLGEDPEAPYLRARALLAEGRYREVLALGLEGTEGRLLRALALERLGRPEEALALARGLPLDREVRLLLGRLYLELGRPLEGVAYLGDTPEEVVLKGRLLLAAFPGKPPLPGGPRRPGPRPLRAAGRAGGVFPSGGARPGGEPPRPGACPPLALAPLRGGLPRASRLRGEPH